MKRILGLIGVMIMLFGFNGCSLLRSRTALLDSDYKTEVEVIKETETTIIEALNHKDRELLKSIFSEDAISKDPAMEDGIDAVKAVNFDMAVLGVTNYSPDTGLSCEVLMESYLKRAVLQQSAENIILMDSSKMDKKSTFHICQIEEVNTVVSDQNVSEQFRGQCEKAGVYLL